MTFWYADDPMRTVKYQSRINLKQLSGSAVGWAQPNMDMELVSFSPAK